MTDRFTARKTRTQSRKLVAIAATLLIATSGAVVALATANTAVADAPSTEFWAGKALEASRPDDGIVTVQDPTSTVVNLNDTITLSVTAICNGPFYGENAADIHFELGETTVNADGSWEAVVDPTPSESPSVDPTPSESPSVEPTPAVSPSEDPTLLSEIPPIDIPVDNAGSGSYQYTGTVTFTITQAPVTLRLIAEGADCFAGGISEDVATFTVVEIACPIFPGAVYGTDGYESDYAVTDQNDTYTQVWETLEDATASDQSANAVNGDTDFQDDALDGFGEYVYRGGDTSGDYVEMNPQCTTFDSAAGTYYAASTGDDGELTYSTSTKYFSTADTTRRTFNITNNTQAASAAQDVTVETNLGSDSDTTVVATTNYGESSNDDGNNDDPVVTQLWGGPSTTVVNGALFPSAPIAADLNVANSRSAAWLAAAARLPSAYFDGIDSAKVLNWGPTSIAPAITREEDEYLTTYTIPALAAGQSVSIVQFAHVQLFSGDYTTAGQLPWVDRTLDNGIVGDAYTSNVTAPDDTTTASYTGYSATGLPAGLAIDSAGIVTGKPTVAGDYTIDITATNADSFEQVATAVTMTVTDNPAAVDLHLNFVVGTSIGSATTTLTGSGLRANSTWTLTLHSVERVFGPYPVSSEGTFSQLFSLPADLEAGAHSLLLKGIAPDGTERISRAWFTLGANGKILALSMIAPTEPELAETGTDATGIATIGGLTALAGLAFLLSALVRRSRRATLS